jgi:hypothetical protein
MRSWAPFNEWDDVTDKVDQAASIGMAAWDASHGGRRYDTGDFGQGLAVGRVPAPRM